MAFAHRVSAMIAFSPSPEHATTLAFRDGLGERFVATESATGERVQMLHLPASMTEVPAFEFALRERTARLTNFPNTSYVRVCRVDRTHGPSPGLAVVSEHAEGIRLSDLLRVASERDVTVDITTAISIIRQLLSATALLHDYAPDVANGLIAPERLIVTPRARLVITEHVLGMAIERLQYSPERLWRAFRIAVSPRTNNPRFNHRTDVLSIGLVTLALVLGRPLRDDEFPEQLSFLLDTARERSALGYARPLSRPLRDWIARALQLQPLGSFASARAAWLDFEKIIAADPLYLSTHISLEMFLYGCTAALMQPCASEPPALAAVPRQPVQPPIAEVLSASDAAREGEIHVEMLPPCPASGDQQPSTMSSDDAIDWSAIAGQSTAVATVRDITQLFDDADLPAQHEGAIRSEPVFLSPRSLDLADAVPAVPAAAGADAVPEAVPGTIDDETFPWTEQTPALNRFWQLRRTAIAAGIVAVLVGGVVVARLLRPTVVAASEMGTLRVETNPAGLPVIIDGIEQGRTPARLSVSAGEHILEVRGRDTPHVVPIKIASGLEVSQFFEFADTPQTDHAAADSEPTSATKSVDSASGGLPPPTVTSPTGPTASLKGPEAVRSEAPPTWGWLAVKAAFPVEIRVGGKVVGSSDVDRIKMSAGRHEIELVNDTQRYRAVRVIYVVPGKVTRLPMDTPATGIVNVNASPWAEVWIGGRRVGETPLANVSVPLGQHEVVFRHPQLGEKRQGITVTAGAPVRLSMDMK